MLTNKNRRTNNRSPSNVTSEIHPEAINYVNWYDCNHYGDKDYLTIDIIDNLPSDLESCPSTPGKSVNHIIELAGEHQKLFGCETPDHRSAGAGMDEWDFWGYSCGTDKEKVNIEAPPRTPGKFMESLRKQLEEKSAVYEENEDEEVNVQDWSDETDTGTGTGTGSHAYSPLFTSFNQPIITSKRNVVSEANPKNETRGKYMRIVKLPTGRVVKVIFIEPVKDLTMNNKGDNEKVKRKTKDENHNKIQKNNNVNRKKKIANYKNNKKSMKI